MFDDLPKALERQGKRIRASLDKTAQKIARDINRELVLSTPVDTGLSRSNWRVSKSGAALSIRPAFAPIPQRRNPAKFKERANAGAAIAGAESVIRTFKPASTNDVELHITNNVDYIETLNLKGSIGQIGPGWVQAAFKAGLKKGLTRSLTR
jgi:hypothetical protein